MARLRVTRTRERFTVEIRGRFSGRDVRRVERLCGRALEYRAMPLTLHFGSGSQVDPSARVLIERLVERGATVVFD